MVIFCSDARERTMRIGKYAWYTEQNTFKEILEIAKNESKPVFAVYSATWCKPCRAVKKETFERDEFGKVAKEVVLLYVEKTEPKSKDYIERHRIPFYPTFRLFNVEGKRYDMPMPDRTVDGFYKWVMDGKAGKFGFYRPVGKTMRIGDVTWYTQENQWEDILEIAGKANKPILVIISMKTSRALKFKNEILPDQRVREAAKQFIPMHVDYTEPNGKELVKKLRALSPLAFLMVSKDGRKLAFENRIDTAEDFLQWVKDVKAGKKSSAKKSS